MDQVQDKLFWCFFDGMIGYAVPRACMETAANETRLEEFIIEQNAEVIASTMPRIALQNKTA